MRIIKWFIPVAAMLALSAVLSLQAQDAKKTTPPKVIYSVQPQYTDEAKAAKIAGTVGLKVVVDSTGSAQDIQVTKSLDEGLDQKAVEAVHQWRFSPATEDGKPVTFSANIEVNFRLQ